MIYPKYIKRMLLKQSKLDNFQVNQKTSFQVAIYAQLKMIF